MDFEKYKNEVPYPKKPKKPMLATDPSLTEVREYADKLEVYDKEIIEYMKQYKLAQKKEASMIEQFKIDLFKELEISSHLKKEELFYFAWKYGHSLGFSEVYNYASDLVVLLK